LLSTIAMFELLKLSQSKKNKWAYENQNNNFVGWIHVLFKHIINKRLIITQILYLISKYEKKDINLHLLTLIKHTVKRNKKHVKKKNFVCSCLPMEAYS
jgi:hypothetical protein